MNSLLTKQPRWLAAASSQRVEELAGRAVLPLQASIAGCISSRWQPHEWGASAQGVGADRNRFQEMASEISTLHEVGQSSICGNCVFLTSAHHAGGPAAFGKAYLVRLTRVDRPDLDAYPAGDPIFELREPIVPDADRAYTVEQMADAWKSIGREITNDDVPLSVDPDDYPLF